MQESSDDAVAHSSLCVAFDVRSSQESLNRVSFFLCLNSEQTVTSQLKQEVEQAACSEQLREPCAAFEKVSISYRARDEKFVWLLKHEKRVYIREKCHSLSMWHIMRGRIEKHTSQVIFRCLLCGPTKWAIHMHTHNQLIISQ